MAKVASVETPGLREDDRQDTLTEDGHDGRYISLAQTPSQKRTHMHRHTDTHMVYILFGYIRISLAQRV